MTSLTRPTLRAKYPYGYMMMDVWMYVCMYAYMSSRRCGSTWMTSLALTYCALSTRNLPKLVDTADHSIPCPAILTKAMQDFTVLQRPQLPPAWHAQLKHQDKHPVPCPTLRAKYPYGYMMMDAWMYGCMFVCTHVCIHVIPPLRIYFDDFPSLTLPITYFALSTRNLAAGAADNSAHSKEVSLSCSGRWNANVNQTGLMNCTRGH